MNEELQGMILTILISVGACIFYLVALCIIGSGIVEDIRCYLKSKQHRRQIADQEATKEERDAMIMEKLMSLDIGDGQEDWEKNAVYSEQEK